MEKHFLTDHVAGLSRHHGPPEPWYNPDGDCIVYQTSDEAVVADRIDEHLTIYRSAETDKAIGYQIKEVGEIIRRFGLGGITVEWAETDDHELTAVSVHSLLLAAYEVGPKTIGRRRGYANALESASKHPRLRLDDVGSLGIQSYRS